MLRKKVTLRRLDRRMRKLRREYKSAASGGFNWLATQIGHEIRALAAQIECEQVRVSQAATAPREWTEG